VRSTIAVTLLVLFSVAWGGWVFFQLFANAIATCDYENDAGCRAFKEYAPPLILWRGLAVELLAIVAFILLRKR
jgi:hypothetical protein